MSDELAKSERRRLKADRLMQAARKGRLAENYSDIDSNPVHNQLTPTNELAYNAIWSTASRTSTIVVVDFSSLSRARGVL